MPVKLLWEEKLEPIFFQKLPQLPAKAKDLIAACIPYIILFFCFVAITGLLLAFGIGSVALGLGSSGPGIIFYVAVVLGVLTVVMYLMSYRRLLARKRSGWALVYYALLIGLVSSVIQLSLLMILIGFAALWIAFQIREKYS